MVTPFCIPMKEYVNDGDFVQFLSFCLKNSVTDLTFWRTQVILMTCEFTLSSDHHDHYFPQTLWKFGDFLVNIRTFFVFFPSKVVKF